MGWVYLDDRFPEHPKILAAGDGAGWLFVAGLAWAARHGYTTDIPKGHAHRLANNGQRRARELVTVGLWHDRGDHYEIHDYQFWNRSAIHRSAQARKAANTRWGNDPPPPMLPHMPEHEPGHMLNGCPSNADAYAGAHAQGGVGAMPPAHTTPTPTPKVQAGSDSSSSTRVPEHDDDDDRPKPTPDPVAGALRLLAQRDLDRRVAEHGPVGDRDAWLAKAADRRAARHAETLAQIDPAGRTAEALADLLEPPLTSPNGERLAGSTGVLEAQERARKRAAACGRCDNGWRDTGTGLVRCECQGA